MVLILTNKNDLSKNINEGFWFVKFILAFGEGRWPHLLQVQRFQRIAEYVVVPLLSCAGTKQGKPQYPQSG